MRNAQILLTSLLFFLSACSPAAVENIILAPSVTPTNESSVTPQPSPAPTQGTPDSLEVGAPALTDAPSEAIPAQLCSPLAEHNIETLVEIVSSPYAPPPEGKDDRHHGVDFAYYNHNGRASVDGEGVQSILAGRVAAAISDRLPYGNMVIIETPPELIPENLREILNLPAGISLYHLYAHLSETPLVIPGQTIECGDLLGYAGMTGYNVPVPHLHLETRLGPANTFFDGMVFYDTQATATEQGNYVRWRTGGEFQHFDPMLLFTDTP